MIKMQITNTKKIMKNIFIIYLLVNISFFYCNKKHDNLEERSYLSPNLESYYKKIKSFSDLFTYVEKISLFNDSGFSLSMLPRLYAVTKERDFVIVDNFNVRNIFVFNKKGCPITKIGSFGRAENQYLFPETLFYQSSLGKYYVYDGDLLRIQIYNEDSSFDHGFSIPLFMEQILVTEQNRIYCYTSGVPNRKGVDKVVYECNKTGKIINSFAKQSKNYCKAAESKGGGIVKINNELFVITPYEYEIRKYNLNGKFINSKKGNSPHYIPPLKVEDKNVLNNLHKRVEYHKTWSHIRQILNFGDELIGVVYSEPDGKKIYLDLYDTALNYITGDIQLPEYVGGPAGLLVKENFLYLLQGSKLLSKEKLSNPSIDVFKLKKPQDIQKF